MSDELGPDGKLHQDGYFTWRRRDGYMMDAKLPADFVLAEKMRAALAAERERWEKAARAALEVMDDLPTWSNAGHACNLLRECLGPNAIGKQK